MPYTPIPIPSSEAVGEVSKKVPQSNNKEKKMRSMRLLFLMVALGAIFTFPAMASATNGHQDHRGACGRSTTSITKGVGDLQYNGVLGKFAAKMGIKSINGNLRKQMTNQLVVGKVAKATTTNNSGCDGHGHTFPAGKRTLYKGEMIVIKAPAKYGKDACVKPGMKGCKRIAVPIKVHFGLPTSCLNGNEGVILVYIWVHTSKHQTTTSHTTPTKPKPTGDQTVTAPQSQGNSGQGNCNSVNSGNLAGPGSVQGSCNNVVVVCYGAGSCSPQTVQTTVTYQWCVDNGGTWSSEKNICTIIIVENPPPPSCDCTPPPTTPTCDAGSTWSTEHQQCEKDGSTTPPPPTSTPGPNPQPSPQDPAPGGHACYSETTGQPVDPILIGGVYLCPAGSYGTPNKV